MTDTSPDLTPGDQPRRSVFLVAIVVLANLYLVGFGLDASSIHGRRSLPQCHWFQCAAEHTQRGCHSGVLRNATNDLYTDIRSAFAETDIHPLTLFVLWAGFGIYPFSLAYTYSVASFAIAALQLTLAFAVFFYLRRRTGHFFLAARRLPRKQKLILRTVVATLFCGRYNANCGCSIASICVCNFV